MKKRILVMEDDSHIRLGLCDALRGESYEVTECLHGAQAGLLIKQRKPDLVILDIMLPGKSGFDLCREIRAAKNRVPVLMLSAKGAGNRQGGGDGAGCGRLCDEAIEPSRNARASAGAVAPRARGGSAAELPMEIAFGKCASMAKRCAGSAARKRSNSRRAK